MNAKEFMDAEVLRGAFKEALEAGQLLEPLLCSYRSMVGDAQASYEAPHETWANIVSNASWVVSAGEKQSLTLDLYGPRDALRSYSVRWDFRDCHPQQFGFLDIGHALIKGYQRVKDAQDHGDKTPSANPIPVTVTYP